MEGLIRLEAHRTVVIAPLTGQELDELYVIRIELDSLAAGLAAANAGEADHGHRYGGSRDRSRRASRSRSWSGTGRSIAPSTRPAATARSPRIWISCGTALTDTD